MKRKKAQLLSRAFACLSLSFVCANCYPNVSSKDSLARGSFYARFAFEQNFMEQIRSF